MKINLIYLQNILFHILWRPPHTHTQTLLHLCSLSQFHMQCAQSNFSVNVILRTIYTFTDDKIDQVQFGKYVRIYIRL